MNLRNRIIILLLVVTMLPLAIGVYIGKKLVKPQYITVTKEIIKPEKVIEVRTIVKEVIAKPVIRPTNATDTNILGNLEKAIPQLTINPFRIIEDKSGKLSVEREVSANLKIDYLEYDLTIQPEVKIVKYSSRKKFKFGQFIYVQKEKVKADMQIIYSPIKIGGVELNAGLGFYGATLTVSKPLYSNIDVHAGYAKKYDGDNAFVTGLSWRF